MERHEPSAGDTIDPLPMIHFSQTAHHITAASCLDVMDCRPAVSLYCGTPYSILTLKRQKVRGEAAHHLAPQLSAKHQYPTKTPALESSRSPAKIRYQKDTEPHMRMNHRELIRPNNAMERSRMLVTVRAYARPAPSIRLAHLER